MNIYIMKYNKERKLLLEKKYKKFPLVHELDLDSQQLNNKISNKINIKDLTDEEFGWYLAGLISSDGSISKAITISFHIDDTSLAYAIKERLSQGYIYFQKYSKASEYRITSKEGIKKVLELTNGKYYSEYKLNFMKLHDYTNKYNIILKPPVDFKENPINSNYFLSGFTDGDGTFKIRYSKSKTQTKGVQVGFLFRIKQKYNPILNAIQMSLGGRIHFCKKAEVFEYCSSSFAVIPNVIAYFNSFPLFSTKYINYLKWEQGSSLIFKREHLTSEGLKIIEGIKNSMNRKLLLQYPDSNTQSIIKNNKEDIIEE